MATSVKKKGLLKGLRYFSQMFVEERKEMQIGLPTDVKHVAHIGWDGPSANAPSWINEFKSSNGGYQSAPMGAGGDAFNNRETEEVKWVSEDKGQKAHSSANVSSSRERDLVPKPLSMDSSGSQVRSPNSQRVPTKRKEKGSKGVRRRKENSGKQKEDPTSDEAPSQSRRIPNKCKKKKKFKDMDGSGKPSAKLPSKQVSKNGSEDALEDRGIGEIKG